MAETGDGLTADQSDAYDLIKSTLRQWGLEDSGFAELIWRLVKEDRSSDYALNEIRGSEAYRQRFPALAEINRKYNLGWDEGKYITQEGAYIEALADLGQAGDRYKDRSQYAQWMLNDVSPAELTRRIDSATSYIYLDAPASVKNALRTQYGLTDDEMVSYMLDPQAMGKELELKFAQNVRKATVMGAASDAGISGLSEGTINDLTQSRYGQDYGTAAAQFSNIAAEGESWNKLADISGEQRLGVDELAADEFGTAQGGQAAKRKKRLASQERARFSGSSAIGAGSLRVSGLGSQ